MGRQRREFSPEYKDEAVKLVVNTGRAVATVACELGIKAIVKLIGAVTTSTGLTVHAELDPADYPTGIKIDDHQMNTLPITPHEFHGQWNYTFSTRDTPEPD